MLGVVVRLTLDMLGETGGGTGRDKEGEVLRELWGCKERGFGRGRRKKKEVPADKQGRSLKVSGRQMREKKRLTPKPRKDGKRARDSPSKKTDPEKTRGKMWLNGTYRREIKSGEKTSQARLKKTYVHGRAKEK